MPGLGSGRLLRSVSKASGWGLGFTQAGKVPVLLELLISRVGLSRKG